MKTIYLVIVVILYLALNTAAQPDYMDGCRGTTKVISARGVMEGWISSPGFSDGAYPPNLNCSYRIETFKGFVIRLYFLELRMEESDSCIRDKLLIREPQENGEDVILTYCGYETPLDYQTKGNVLEVRFDTDEIGTGGGFRFRWNAIVARDFCYRGEREFLCRNRGCIDKYLKCNGEDDCLDGSDEEDCDYVTDKNQTCGIQKIPPKTYLMADRIVGGVEANPGSWPWMADLHDISIFPSGHICGGTLLNSHWVITTALCFRNLRRARDWRVKLGNHEKFNFNEGERVRYLTRIVIYGMENTEVDDAYDLPNDIALVKLSAPVKMTRFIQPVCLPNENSEPVNGTKCYSTGWGATRGTGNSDVLKQVVVPVISNQTCEKAFGDDFKKDNMICAGDSGVMNAICSGDSGGPLMCQSKENVWTLVGVATVIPRGTTGTNMICGLRNNPSVFHKVSKRVKWIEETIQE